jgi:rhodanese-related sulfurtransferase
MPNSVKELVAAANAVVPKISPQDAAALIGDRNVLVLDVRDAPELQSTGKVRGARHVARGMLEFRADPESPYHDQAFDRDKTVLVYCASGGRSALAGKTMAARSSRSDREMPGKAARRDRSGVLSTPDRSAVGADRGAAVEKVKRDLSSSRRNYLRTAASVTARRFAKPCSK